MVVSGQRPHENPDNAPRYQAQTKKLIYFYKKIFMLKKNKKKHENPGNAHYDVIRGSLFMVLDIPEN